MNLKPSAICMLAGGAVLFIATFIDWVGAGPFGANGLETDAFGLLGVFTMLIGLIAGGVTAARTFGNLQLPNILGFSPDQMIMILGFAAFLITFGLQFSSSSKFGVTLAWLGSAAIVVGGVLKQNDN